MTVAIPCYNEAPTIGKVVADFRKELPQAEILVVDNDSSDGSPDVARAAGARVVTELRRGKGFAVQRILRSVENEICVVVDGDDTYLAEDVHALLSAVADRSADMAVGDRLGRASTVALTDVRRLGNRIFLALINLVFRGALKDPLSGYRAFSRRFVDSVSLRGGGFETETELTLRAQEQALRVVEVPIGYRARPQGSHSKLSPLADGLRILATIGTHLVRFRPALLLGVASLALLLAASLQVVARMAGWLSMLSGVGHGLLLAINTAVVSGLLVLWFALKATPARAEATASPDQPGGSQTETQGSVMATPEGAAGLATKSGERSRPS